ncbi:MAG: 3-hydroxyacyl-[acyl-carrier-protein] dehydratase FabZ, partial [Syntrophothermus sp.]
VMPGVLIVEAMAQTGGIMMMNSLPNMDEKLVYFMQINNVKFRKPVVPGDQLVFEVEMVTKKSKIFMMSGKAYVDNVLVTEADFMAGVVDRDIPKQPEKQS